MQTVSQASRAYILFPASSVRNERVGGQSPLESQQQPVASGRNLKPQSFGRVHQNSHGDTTNFSENASKQNAVNNGSTVERNSEELDVPTSIWVGFANKVGDAFGLNA